MGKVRNPLRGPLALLAASMTLVLSMAGCGSATSSGASAGSGSTTWKSVKVDVGGGRTITVKGPPRIAYFPAGDLNNYLTVRGQALKAAVAKIPGATVTEFNSRWDATTQLNMIQSAIASKKYNAFIVDTNDGNSQCNLLTKTAPAANIAVVNLSGPICGLSSKPDGRDAVADGEVGAVGNNNILAIRDYLNYMIKKNPGPQKVIVETLPPLHPLTPEIDAALAMIKQTHPEFQVVAKVSTDGSTLQGQQKTAPLLLAHPDATVLFSAYADITLGAITAIKSAGLAGKIKVYDQFGSKAIVAHIKDGTVAATTGGYPAGSAEAGVEMLRKAFEGQQGPRIILGDGGPVPADGSTWNGVNIIDKTNLADYNPQF
jgi:ribose transport system substrate-binding protein